MSTDQVNVILIHGNGGGTASDGWFPSVVHELTARGITTVARDFPDAVLAREEYWLPFLRDTLHADEHSLLIGCSSGAIAAMRYAETTPLYGSVLIGTYYTDLDDENERLSGYFNRPWNWEAIRGNQRWIAQFSSTDDPYIPIEDARFVRDMLHTEYHEFTNRGHFDESQTEFPELVDVVAQQLSTVKVD